MKKIQEPIDHRTQISRRRLLSGIGALGVALTSPVWKVSTAFGKDATTPGARRFIGVFSANGTVASEFFPGCSSLLSKTPNSCGDAVKSGSETAISADSLGRILKPMAAHVNRMVVLKGVDMISTVSDKLGTEVAKPGGPHMKGPGAMLTGGSLMTGSFQGAGGPAGNADRISVDQFIAGRVGQTTPFPSLEFGVAVGGGAPLNCISYAGANQPNTAIDDPIQMYKKMFANSDISATQLQKLLADRKSVLDFLQADMAAVSSRLSAADRTRLDAHLTGIRTMEKQLTNATVACQKPGMPAQLDPKDANSYAKNAKVQMDLMLLALSCGMTNVATFMFANADSWQWYPFATGFPAGSAPAGVNEEHHSLSHGDDHDAANIEKLVLINVWHGMQVNYMLDSLAAQKDADGSSMLDNTVLLWGNELGVGNTHDYRNIPWLIAGGGGGTIKGGRYLQYPGIPHNDMLVSICHAMGFNDVTTFGIPGVCTGPLQSPSLTG